jgi:tRNA G18 (ribose-2'-O)-methylase SpoU
MPEVGVGPWEGAWPEDARFDPELLTHGDTRNVVDRYRYWKLEAIVADLDTHRHPVHIAIENLEHDFNIGSIIRTANAFLVAEVHIVGRKRWNRRGAMVTDRYQHIRHHPDPQQFATWARAHDLPLLGIDTGEESTPLETTRLPETCVLVFGQEGSGLSVELAALCSQQIAISQFGSTRSINVGAAAAIAMHTWVRQHVFGHDL